MEERKALAPPFARPTLTADMSMDSPLCFRDTHSCFSFLFLILVSHSCFSFLEIDGETNGNVGSSTDRASCMCTTSAYRTFDDERLMIGDF